MIGLLLIFLVLLLVLLGVSVGVAALLHWLLPAVGMDMALVASVIAVGQAMLLFGRLLNALPLSLPILDELAAAEEESEEPPTVIVDPDLPLLRRQRRRKRTQS